MLCSILFIRPNIDGNLGSFQFVVLISSATVNILELVFRGTYTVHISFRYITSRSGIIESKHILQLTFNTQVAVFKEPPSKNFRLCELNDLSQVLNSFKTIHCSLDI